MELMASILMAFFMMIFGAIVNIGLFLITNFDFTNSLMLSGLIQLVTCRMEISTPVRWMMFFGIFFIALIIQHTFTLGRIIFTIFSVLLFVFIAVIFTYGEPTRTVIVNASAWMLIAGILNYVRWSVI